nr:MAG TPA: hypothetical protein [Caudoviricetes sp.]
MIRVLPPLRGEILYEPFSLNLRLSTFVFKEVKYENLYSKL